MSKLNSITENKYTLRDIFVRNHEVWLAIPLFCYLLTPLVHMVVFAVKYSPSAIGIEEIAHMITTGEWVGDYYLPIVMSFTALAAVIAFISFFSHLAYAKQVGLKRNADSIPMVFFAAMCLLIVISTIVNRTAYTLILGLSERAEGVVMILCYFIVYYLCGSKIRSEKIKYTAIGLFLLTSVVIATLVMLNFLGIKIKIIVGNTFAAIFYHFNFYSYYLTIAIMLSSALFALEKNKAVRTFAFFSLCLNSVVLAFNDSFGGFLACLVAFVFLVVAASIKKGRFNFAALVTLLIFLAICFVVGLKYKSFFSELVTLGNDVGKIATNAEDADEAGTARWGLWRATWGYIKERPFIGYGIEGTVERLAADTGQEKVHNEYLDYAVEYGIPAALLYIGGLISIFIKALIRRKSVDNATLVCLVASFGYIGSAFFGNRMIFILPFFFVFLGLANNTEPPYEKLGLEKEEAAKAAALQNENTEVTEELSDEITAQENAGTVEESVAQE